MRPVLILQFMADDAPAYLDTWLARQGAAAEVRLATQGPPFPQDIEGYRALALLGGAMSVNDDLPYLRQAEQLIRQAMDRGVPVLGHCLGGQLMAHALGAAVHASPAFEVGWHGMQRAEAEAARDWLGPQPSHAVFHWHYEAFDLPAGAVALASSPQCPHQAFSIGPHIALQFHVEVDAAKVDLWVAQNDPQYLEAQRHSPTVHAAARVRQDTARFLAQQQLLADRIYGRWLGLASSHDAAS